MVEASGTVRAFGLLETAIRLYNSSRDLQRSADALSGNECVPDFTQDLSSIIATCNGSGSCERCFEVTIDRLNFYRQQLARLRCIYNNTKTYKDNALAVGDNLSGIHAMAGVAWQRSRAMILGNFQNTQRIYDTKSQEFISGLYETLGNLSACMSTIGENNWYEKSGFIYFEFMKERYKRPD